MEHSLPLISTLVIAFTLALVFGYCAERFFKSPPLVGYLLAGIAAGQYTPGVYADPELASQLSEIGVMLLMFGVGLHFSLTDLLRVKHIAIPGAVLQMAAATLLGGVIAHHLWDWPWAEALVLGLCLSCASTVVLIKALEVRGYLQSSDGQLAVGWLVVEDIATVLILVILPVVAGILHNPDGTLSAKDVVWEIGKTLLNVSAFIALMFVVGRRALPWALKEVARIGSRELFTLFILGTAMGVAYGAAVFFHVSFALGAFFAGAVMRESSFSHRAASETLPFQDAFSVLFFVGVGMLFDWHILLEAPLQVLVVLFIIMIGKSLASFALVHLFRLPLHTSILVSAALAQIGEFSFILVVQAKALGLADDYAVNLIVGAAILSIALNPVAFSYMPKLKTFLVEKYRWARLANQRAESFDITQHSQDTLPEPVVVIGDNDDALAIASALHTHQIDTVMLLSHRDEAKKMREHCSEAITGSATDPQTLIQAKILQARQLLLFDNSTESLRIVEIAHTLKNDLPITIVAEDPGVWVDMPEKPYLHFINIRQAAIDAVSGSVLKALVTQSIPGHPVGKPMDELVHNNDIKANPT